jgi:hypothetical protein
LRYFLDMDSFLSIDKFLRRAVIFNCGFCLRTPLGGNLKPKTGK